MNKEINDNNNAMRYEKEVFRPDQTEKLGEPLSAREVECYLIICRSGVLPIKTPDIFKIMFGYPGMNMPSKVAVNTNVGTNIRRIRLKLGDEAIINRPGFGYIARIQLIQYLVVQNIENSTNSFVDEIYPLNKEINDLSFTPDFEP